MRNQKINIIQNCLRIYVIKLLALKPTGQYILKTFLNDEKILCIPGVFHDNKFVIVDFKEKTELFNLCFTEQCSLPKNNNKVPKNLLFLTEKCVSNIQISNENIIKIINNFDPNKALGHKMISIRMLKLCSPYLCKPRSIIFKSWLSHVKFPVESESPPLPPLKKKEDKQCIKNYGPVSLLPICSKIFQRLLFNELYKFFNENDLLSSNQVRLLSPTKYINLLIMITR